MQNSTAPAFTIDSMLTIKQTEELFNVSRSTVMRWAKEGKLEKLSFGINTSRITGKSVAALIQSARNG